MDQEHEAARPAVEPSPHLHEFQDRGDGFCALCPQDQMDTLAQKIRPIRALGSGEAGSGTGARTGPPGRRAALYLRIPGPSPGEVTIAVVVEHHGARAYGSAVFTSEAAASDARLGAGVGDLMRRLLALAREMPALPREDHDGIRGEG